MRHSTPRALVGAATVLVALAAGTSPAGAGADKGHHARATVTEDTDHNDGGTPDDVADAGDDRHPSGRDRSVERGGSGTQGSAEADPDDDGRGPDRSNGGVDQPGGPGGHDLADQDGNNGCGNDDDFEDDNEGWCGRPAEAEARAEARAESHAAARTESHAEERGTARVQSHAAARDEAQVASRAQAHVARAVARDSSVGGEALHTAVMSMGGFAQPAAVLSAGASRSTTPSVAPRVLATGAGASVAAGALATTGLGVVPMLVAALAMILAGTVMRRMGAARA